MYKWVVLVVLAVWVAFAGVARAQEAATCDLDAARAKAVEELTVIADDDDESLATGLRTVSDDLAAAVAACSELHWSGKGDWISGKITIPEGVYKFVVVGIESMASIIATNLNDECTTIFYNYSNHDNASQTEYGRGEVMINLQTSCDVIFQVDGKKQDNWEFWFEKIQ